jgi:hypothetical protein
MSIEKITDPVKWADWIDVPSRREARYLRTIVVLRRLIADLSEALTDEGGDWSPVGLDELRHRVGNALPPDECPDWLRHYRDPAVVQS